MIVVPILDFLLFAINIYVAVAYRGTVWGWLSTLIVIWFVYTTIKIIRET